IGTIDSQTKSANGAVISGSSLVMQNADASFPGLVSTGTQTFAGAKTFSGNLTTNGAFQVDGNTTLGNATTDTTTSNGSIVANTATAGISSGSVVGSQTYNTDTLTVSSALFNNGDIVQVTNSGGTVFFTRVTAGGGTTTLTVSPRVNIDTTFTVTTFNSQNIGATPSNYTSTANRFYQASFLSGINIDGGNGSTLLSNGQLFSSDAFYFNSGSYVFKNNANSTTAFQVQDTSGITVLGVDSTNKRIFSTVANGVSAVGFTFNTPNYTTSGAKLISLLNNGTEKMYVDKDGNLGIATGAAYAAGAAIGSSTTCSGGQFLQNQVATGGLTTGGTCANAVTTVGTFSGTSIANGGSISGNTLTLGVADGTNPGMVSTTTQTIAGAKTLTSALTINTSSVDTGLVVTGNVNSFYQMNIQNTNSGSSASSDYVATADNGTSTTNYVDFGINGSAGGAAPFTGANDAYLYASDSNNLHIGALGSSGAVKFYTTGGTGAPSLKLTLDSLGALTQAASSSTTTAFTLNANSLTSGNGLAISNTGTGLTGNAFSVTSGSTSAVTNGIVRYNFTGAHTGNGVQVDDATTTGTVYQINASALTTGTAFQVTGPSSKNLIRIMYEAADPLDKQRVIIGGGGISASKPDSLARDQLYVFGRINSSWNMFSQDFVTGSPAVAADGFFLGAYYDENVGTLGTSPSGRIQMQNTTGASGMARLTFTGTLGTGPWASNWGTGGGLVTERSLNPVFEARVQASSNTDVRHIVGFTDMALNATTNADTNNSANEVFFRKTAAGTNWEAVTRNGSGTENVTTLATACAGSSACTTTALRTMRIELENVGANGTARFYIDGTLVATHTTTAVPANTNRLGWLLTNTPTTTTYTGRVLDMDYVRVWSDDPPDSVAPEGIAEGGGLDTNTQTQNTETGDTPPVEDSSNEALLDRIKTLESDVNDLKQYKDVLTTEMLGDASTKKAVFIANVEFRNQVEFSADALFKANVNVDGTLNANGRVVVSNNTGTITVQPGQTEVQVLFAKPLVGKPNVFLSTENPDVKVVAQTRTKDGFIIKLSQPITDQVDVQWFAVEKQ
ncbi:hypothetical protein HY004_02025, partial [Candidatus Saccharibacteria bacterium]|nr:hypothetical protein [Candidatus Saccharibacteria bacterium]